MESVLWAMLETIKDVQAVERTHNECIMDLTKGLKYLAEFVGKQGEKITRLENRVELLQDKVNLLERKVGPPDRADGL